MWAFSLKQRRCRHCGCVGYLNRHSHLLGNDVRHPGLRSKRGQRVFCSDRGKRGGCGRTYSLMVSDVLPRHTVRASVLWQWLVGLLEGKSVGAAAVGLPFALETFRGLGRKMGRVMERVRTRIWSESPPPPSEHGNPLLQTCQHLQAVFGGSGCVVAAFQDHFQVPFLG